MPFQKSSAGPIHRVHHDPSSRTGWPGEDRHDRRARQKRSTKAADCYLCAQRAMVGAALAALPRSVTEIDGVVPAHSRT